MSVILGALIFGCLVYFSTIGGERLVRGRIRAGGLAVEALRVSLCSVAAVSGGILVGQSAPPATIFAIAIVCTALGAVAFLAALDCRVPLVIPAAALATLVGSALLQGNPGPLASACATCSPFAATAFLTKGSRADWRDTVVAALGGAACGLPLGIVIAGFACLALVLVRPYLARLRSGPQPPAGFSSALAGTFLVALIGQLALT